MKYAGNYKVKPSFYVINFDEIMHRCNPLEPKGMTDITDATEFARTIMLGMNREWLKKQGDFFVESAISFVTALIWYLKKYEDGKYCTLPHAIEMDYKRLFTVLTMEEEIQALLNPFVSAWEKEEWASWKVVSEEDIAENYKKIRADIQELITREIEEVAPVTDSNDLPAKPIAGEKAKAESARKPKISNPKRKAKQPQKKSLSL